MDMRAEEEFGKRDFTKLQDPRLSTQREIDDHNLTHLPYKSWCAHCIAGKGKVAHHTKQDWKDGLPELHLDYCFLSTEGSPLATILVAKEKQTKMSLSTVVPLKGASI